jgi:hypothetical protein
MRDSKSFELADWQAIPFGTRTHVPVCISCQNADPSPMSWPYGQKARSVSGARDMRGIRASAPIYTVRHAGYGACSICARIGRPSSSYVPFADAGTRSLAGPVTVALIFRNASNEERQR